MQLDSVTPTRPQAYNKAWKSSRKLPGRLRRALVAMTRSEFDTAREDAEVLLQQAPNNPGSHYVSEA